MCDSITWASPDKDTFHLDRHSHIWRIPLDPPAAEIETFRQVLSADELARAQRFHFEKHRIRFIAARGFLRTILGQYLEKPGSEINFEYGAYGKPNLPENPFYFNLSHSHYMAVLGIYKHYPLGIDIEWLHRKIELMAIAKRFFAPNEYLALEGLPEAMQREGFFNCWTRKEAYIKADGAGLQIPLSQFEVTLSPDEPVRLKSTAHNPEAVKQWKLAAFDLTADYRVALAVHKDECGQKFYDAHLFEINNQG